MGITEPGFQVQRLREVLVSDEFGSIVKVMERRANWGRRRKIARRSRSVASAVLLFKGAAKVRRVMRSLQRQEVAALGAELQEVALPVAEFLTPRRACIHPWADCCAAARG